jgi:anaerobic selenocysteine-containing dehydrogenase
MGSSRDEIRDVWGARTPFHGEPWPERVDEHVVETPDRWVQSCCVLCSHGCGLDIGVRGGRIVGVRGRRDDRVSRGRLGPKGLNGWMANASPDRLTAPLVRRDGRLAPASWDEAMELVARRARGVKDRYGSGALALYSSGQLFLEEYYTQALVFRVGLGTNHVDGNTRLCTATAAVSLIQSFGTDGDPGTFDDYDVTDAIFLVGMNMAETHTVLWMRLLDRLRGANPPALVVVDPRRTATAAEARVHLRPRLGTNVALLNGILHLFVANDWIDHAFVRDHTVGFELLRETVSRYPPQRVEEITGVPAADLREAARILGTARTFVSACLQGLYQANQATAAAVQLNNINLVRGMIGKPGGTVFQMNGQPTAHARVRRRR